MDQSIDKASICSPIGSDSDNSQGSRVSRKRARDSAKAQCFEEQFDINDDGRPKTRRVNPQRLALRLGPELVAEMEALIVPGAKMPTFAVRKDFQERYCVDRRHIYDYFHSRGLRVSKEDKHTNLIRGRAMKAAAAAAAAVANSASSPTTAVSAAARPVNPAPSKVQAILTKGRVPPVKASKKRKLDSVNPRRTFLVPSTGDTSREISHSPISEPAASWYSNRSMETDCKAFDTSDRSVSDSPVTPSPIPTPFDTNVTVSKDDSLDFLPFPSAAESCLSPLLVGGHNTILDSEYLSFCVDAEAPSTFDNSLGQSERTALYNLVQNSLLAGTTNGNSGSYDACMKDWGRLSGRVAALAVSGKDVFANPYALDCSSTLVYGYNGEPSPDSFDLRNWLSEDLTREDAQVSQAFHSNTSASSGLSGVRTVYLGRYDSYPEPGSIISREHILHSRAQARARTTSARGQI